MVLSPNDVVQWSGLCLVFWIPQIRTTARRQSIYTEVHSLSLETVYGSTLNCHHFPLCHTQSLLYLRQQISYRGADKPLARPGRKQTRKHVRDARDFNNIETRAVIKFFFFLQGRATKEIHAILTETLACLLPVWAKDLSAPLVKQSLYKTGNN